MKIQDYIDLIERFSRHCMKTLKHNDFQLILPEPVEVEMRLAVAMGRGREILRVAHPKGNSYGGRTTITVNNLLHVHVVLEGRIINIEVDAWPAGRIGAEPSVVKDVNCPRDIQVSYHAKPVLEHK